MTPTRTQNANRHACIYETYPHFEQVDQHDYREELEDVIESLSTPPFLHLQLRHYINV